MKKKPTPLENAKAHATQAWTELDSVRHGYSMTLGFWEAINNLQDAIMWMEELEQSDGV